MLAGVEHEADAVESLVLDSPVPHVTLAAAHVPQRGPLMDVFRLHDRLIADYASYVKSFIQIRDPKIGEHVEKSLDEGLLWPEPLIQLNPSFEPGEWIDDLIKDGTLHPECGRIFRIKPAKT